MVLVDTSVWIRFLYDRRPYAAQLDRLLNRGEVAGHELVFGELLIGDRGGRWESLRGYGLMRKASRVAHDEVVAFVRANRLHGEGIGWIDAHLLASALVDGAPLWTADEPLARLAGRLGVAYRPGAG